MGQANSGLLIVAKKYNIHLITSRRSYSLKEVADLLGTDRKTCSRWVKEKGLKVIAPNTNPILIMGSDLRTFLKDKRSRRRVALAVDEFYCFKCHRSQKAKEGSVEIIKTGRTVGREKLEQLQRIGICEVCGTKLHRFIKVSQKD